MLIDILHTVDWLFLALNTQLINGALLHIHGTPDTIRDKLIRWLTTPSAIKGWMGILGLALEIVILWSKYFCAP